MKKIIFFLIIFPFCLWAEEYQFGADSAIYPSEGLEKTEFQLWTGFDHTAPLLRGDGALTAENNLKIEGTLSVSPVSLGTDLVFQLTPIAFLTLEQGTHIGTGWSLSDKTVGLGINSDGDSDKSMVSQNGYVSKIWLGASLQFDLAAILPDAGEYSHLVLQTSFRILYQRYSGADNEIPWCYQADDGENFNGFVGKTQSVLGYIIPRSPVDFAGFMLETENYLGSVASLSKVKDGGWGSDFLNIRFGPLANWQIGKQHSLTLLAQWKNNREISEDSKDENFFMDRSCTGSSYLSFERIALSYKFIW